jgi:GT2 family glycosyltransferase
MASSARAARRRQERAADKPAFRADTGGVFLAIPSGRSPELQFVTSLQNMIAYDASHSGHIIGQGAWLISPGTNVAHQRNQLVRKFLETGIEWLWFVDDDMVFEPDILDQMLASADAKERPILGALCFAWIVSANQQVTPTIYMFGEKDGEIKLVRHTGYPRDSLVPVNATGTGCVLIHRRVFVELAKRWQTPFLWFDYSEWGHGFSSWGQIPGTDVEYAGPGDHIGEDITFCLRAASEHGNRADYEGGGEIFPVFVDTRIKCGHVKNLIVDEAEYDFRHPMRHGLPPTFVIVPVKGEHAYTESLLRQLAAQKNYAGIFVYDNGSDTDPYTGYLPDECEVIPAAGMSIHEMWNAGIRKARRGYVSCNIAILNNDLNIGPNFLEGLAQHLRSSESLWVVSPNYDGRNFPGDIQGVKGIAAGRMDGTGGIAGFAFMVKGELFDHGLPLFDEQYEFWYGDTDFIQTVDALGGMCGIVRSVAVEHIDGGSKTAGDGTSRLKTPELQAKADRDRVRFEKKWAA